MARIQSCRKYVNEIAVFASGSGKIIQDLMEILLMEAHEVTDEADLRLNLRNPAFLFDAAMRVTQRMLQSKPKPRLEQG